MTHDDGVRLMKITFSKEDGTTVTQDISSLTITLNNGETLEISEDSEGRPPHLSEGVTLWGGKMPQENATLDELKSSTRVLGIYPLAANVIHVFPVLK